MPTIVPSILEVIRYYDGIVRNSIHKSGSEDAIILEIKNAVDKWVNYEIRDAEKIYFNPA
jgi:hypothetical protein